MSGARALTIFKNATPDFVLLDRDLKIDALRGKLRTGDGVIVAGQMHKIDPDVPIIIVAAWFNETLETVDQEEEKKKRVFYFNKAKSLADLFDFMDNILKAIEG